MPIVSKGVAPCKDRYRCTGKARDNSTEYACIQKISEGGNEVQNIHLLN